VADLIQRGHGELVAVGRPKERPIRCPSALLDWEGSYLGHIKFGYIATWSSAVLQPVVSV